MSGVATVITGAESASLKKKDRGETGIAPDPAGLQWSTGQSPRRFFRTRFPLALALFLALNLFLAVSDSSHQRVLDESVIQNSESEARQQGPWPWWVARAYLMREKAPDIVLFGSSQMGSATFTADAVTLHKTVDCLLHRHMSTLENNLERETGCHFDTANLAMSGAMVSDVLMLSRALFTENHKPRLVIASISPRDFIDNDLPGPSASGIFKFLSPYTVIDDLQSAAYPDWLSRFDWILGRYFPMKRSQQQALALVTSCIEPLVSRLPDRERPGKSTLSGAMPKDKKAFLQAIFGSVGDVKPGDWLTPAMMPKIWVDNTSEYLHRYKNPDPPVYPHERQFFKAFLADMKRSGIPVFVVEMPTLPMNRALLPASFWDKYQGWLKDTCQEYDAQLFDLSHSSQFTVDDYLDTVHLNAQGGKRFFKILSDALVRSEKFSPALDRKRVPRESEPDDLGPSAAVGTWN